MFFVRHWFVDPGSERHRLEDKAMVKRRVARPRSTATSGIPFLGVSIIFFSLILAVFLYSVFTRHPHRSSPTIPVVTRVQVLNGCGVDGLAARVAKFLRRQGYDVVDIGNTPLLLESLIVDRVGNRDAAQKLAKLLGVKRENIIQQSCDYLELDLTVILGRDYKKLTLQ